MQIQLLTYTDAICKQEDVMPAGIFYFSLLEQMVKAEKRIDEDEIEEMIRKNFKMRGLIVANVKVIKMNDNSLKSGSSKLVPAALTASGTVNEKWTNGVKQEEFKVLQDYIYKTIKDISKETTIYIKYHPRDPLKYREKTLEIIKSLGLKYRVLSERINIPVEYFASVYFSDGYCKIVISFPFNSSKLFI